MRKEPVEASKTTKVKVSSQWTSEERARLSALIQSELEQRVAVEQHRDKSRAATATAVLNQVKLARLSELLDWLERHPSEFLEGNRSAFSAYFA